MTTGNVVPVLLCGGQGRRLWPLSTLTRPKQFMAFGGQTFLQATFTRAQRLLDCPANRIISVTTAAYEPEARRQLAALGHDATNHLLSEPLARNTGPAVALAALHVCRYFGDDTLMVLMPTDHHIADEPAFRRALDVGRAHAINTRLVTFGIHPVRPETGFGYIRCGAPKTSENLAFDVTRFVEKPDKPTAKNYLNSGDYLWNSGIYMARADSLIALYRQHASSVLEDVARGDYGRINPVSFDVAIAEKASGSIVVPCAPRWHDIGTPIGFAGALAERFFGFRRSRQ